MTALTRNARGSFIGDCDDSVAHTQESAPLCAAAESRHHDPSDNQGDLTHPGQRTDFMDFELAAALGLGGRGSSRPRGTGYRQSGRILRYKGRILVTAMTIAALRSIREVVGNREIRAAEPSIRSRITRAAVTTAFFSVVVKLVAVASTLLIASLFGTGDDLEAYLVAFVVPSFLFQVVSGSFSSAMIPTYVQVTEQRGPAQAQALFSRVMVFAIGILCLVSIGSALVFPYVVPLLATGFSAAKIALTQSMFYLLLPVIVFKGVSTVFASVLHSHKRFSLVASAPVALPLASIVVILSWTRPTTRIYAVALGTVIGMLVELIVLGWGLRRIGVPVLPRWRPRSSSSRQVMAQYLPMVAGSMLMGGTTLVDQSMAASLSPGSVASLNYGGRFVGVILHIAAGGIGAAVLPFFSSLVEGRDWLELRRILMFYGKRILLLSAALSVILVALSEPIIGVALQRGVFSEADTAVVARVQAAYALQIPFYICGIMLVRVISSMIANHFLVIVSFLNLVLNIVFNYLFMRRWGVAGIALSTSVVYLSAFAFLAVIVWLKVPKTDSHET